MSDKGTERIKNCFMNLKRAEKTGLITFVTAGDPTLEISADILSQLPQAGADIIEIGMPFSDPMADGPAIQASSLRALKNGTNCSKILKMVEKFREQDDVTPIILMGYFNPIYIYGVEKFVVDASRAGVDGFIIVDLPPEETEVRIPVEDAGLSLIYLTSPTTHNQRVPDVVKNASGFIYHVSVLGITGTTVPSNKNIEKDLNRIRSYTDLPIAVGFGIKTPEQAREISAYADAVVVGSAFVNKISECLDIDGKIIDDCVVSVVDLVKDIKRGLNN